MSAGANVSHGGSPAAPSAIPPAFLSHLPPAADVAVAVFLIISGSLSVAGNGIVLLVFSRKRSKMRPPELMTVNLAICDFGYSLLGAPFLIYSSVSHAWQFGESGCIWYGVQGFVFGIGSLITTSLISLDRCLKICSLRYGQWIERRHMAMAVGLVWLYTIVWATLPVLGFGSYGPEPFGTSCTINWWGLKSSVSDRLYISLILALCFALPTLIIIASYVAILLTVHRSGRSLAAIPSSAVTQSNKDLRLTKIAAVVCSTFLLAWTPYAIVSLYSALVLRDEHGVDEGIQEAKAQAGLGALAETSTGITDFLNLPAFFNWSSADSSKTAHSSGSGSHGHHYVSGLPPEVTVIPAIFAKSHCMINPVIYQVMNKEFREDVYYMFCGGGRNEGKRRGRGRDDSCLYGNRGSISLSYCHSWRGRSTKTVSSVVEQVSAMEKDAEEGKAPEGFWQDSVSAGWPSLNNTSINTQVNLHQEQDGDGVQQFAQL
ncbi:opsin 9 isoform X1 [Scleropages formosus]|uniref:Opsin 9 n=1 Tax=Scleropages formosus TaxID=113540 RepID=A0A8C9QVL7_SCLFO|nr:opsin-5-like isoform X1 [Scleropages formosus]XP_018592867.2 opsin-5-like isoform X1 [Scleropages formosus]